MSSVLGVSRPQPKFSLWPMFFTAFFLLWVCLGLNHFAASRDIPEFRCNAELLTSNLLGQSDGELLLNINHRNDSVVLEYLHRVEGNILGSLSLTSDLLGLEIASMTYKLLLKEGEITGNTALDMLPQNIQKLLITHTSQPNQSRLPFDIQILDMDKNAGYSVLRLKPGNNLWVCEIQH
ncbi:hypothetical protein [Shewanella gelidii]|uniref:Uncharacterized protein n=1 Tax=Shewanella gelidii TaxID=1642821 RepID=A0A917NDM6_9GAMM|nr:hypothetical protein [Shewanella gelidii]MCL1099317.1 hypothetical protein [Shewanella gelidii]GGI91957.1 hypothetical protein GCM10009332_31560 [Shewanella gelidii]